MGWQSSSQGLHLHEDLAAGHDPLALTVSLFIVLHLLLLCPPLVPPLPEGLRTHKTRFPSCASVCTAVATGCITSIQ